MTHRHMDAPASCPPMTSMPPTAAESVTWNTPESHVIVSREHWGSGGEYASEPHLVSNPGDELPPELCGMTAMQMLDYAYKMTSVVEVTAPGDAVPVFVRGRAEPVIYVAPEVVRSPAELDALRRSVCQHKHREPVTLLITGEHVADLCLDCDAQL